MAAGNIFSFFAGQRRIVYNKLHGDCRLRNFLEGNRAGIVRRTERVSDMNIRNTGNSHDGADVRFFHFCFVQAVKFIQLADFNLFLLVRFMVIDNYYFLIDADGSVIHLADSDPSYIFIIVDGTDQYLGSGFRITFGSRNILKDCLKKRNHIPAGNIHIQCGGAGFGGGKNKGAV